ncbi:hypothetical protein [Burkholderia cenocepacia]|uniref:hypothetical protein n=1 Tax=Burkholderia cenocepacia TaxID=95486 RepID=UPI003843EF09
MDWYFPAAGAGGVPMMERLLFRIATPPGETPLRFPYDVVIGERIGDFVKTETRIIPMSAVMYWARITM